MKRLICFATIMLCLMVPAAAQKYDPTTGQQLVQVQGTVPIPTGAATAANQTNGNQVTQVTGTVAVTAAGAATAANQTNGAQVAQTTFTPTTYQGTIALTAATSTTLTSANVAMASSTVLPSTFAKLMLVNVGTNPGVVCWFGGTASITSNCETLAANASDSVNLGNFATPPTLFSTLGTTFAFRN